MMSNAVATAAEPGVINAIVDKIHAGRRFLLTSHRKPDGDSIGSEMALAMILEQLGKEAIVHNRDPHPSAFDRLPGVGRIRVGELPPSESVDAIFVIECPEKDRPGLDGLDDYFLINIDHHDKNRMYARLNWVDLQACAVGEMIYDLAAKLGARITPEIATHLYVSIATDTGFFHYTNTDARAFEVCADLARAGSNPAFVADAILDHNRAGQILLTGRCLSRLELDSELGMATIAMFQKDLEDIDVSDADTDGIIGYPRSIDGIEIAVFFKEVATGGFRVGLRSKTSFNVAEVAAEFGGGGHPQASGCSVPGTYEEARRKILESIRKRMVKGRE